MRKINDKIEELGLKVNVNKTKALGIKMTEEYPLTLGYNNIEWVTQHQILGIWFDKQLTFTKEVDYLRERTRGRLSAMRFMQGIHKGAKYNILKTFYTHAVRSIVDYAAPALINLNDRQAEKL